MGDDQHAGAGHVAGGLEHLEDLGLHRDVEGGGGFVADDQVWIAGDRDGDHHALTLTAGEFVREGSGPRLGSVDADQIHQFDGTPPRLRLAHLSVMHGDRLGDLVTDGVDRSQGRHWILNTVPIRAADP